MAKNNKKPLPIKIKSIIGVFSLLGVFVVGLGMLAITQKAGQRNTDDQTKAAYFQCQEYQLTQIYYRGNQGWVRNVPIVAGKEQWTQAEQFRMFVDLNVNPTAHPGSGEVRDINVSLQESGRSFHQQLVRGDTAYWRRNPTSAIGTVDWNSNGWNSFGSGYSGWQAFGGFSVAEDIKGTNNVKAYFYRSIYIDNKAYSANSSATFANGVKIEGDNSSVIVANKTLLFDLNVNPTAIPGSGPVQAIGDYVSQDNTILNQTWYRGNVGYMRQVPIRDYKPDYSSATPIQAVVDLNKTPNALPGSGEMQATTNFVSCKN